MKEFCCYKVMTFLKEETFFEFAKILEQQFCIYNSESALSRKLHPLSKIC